MKLVDASIAVIGVGANNKYGHPNEEILYNLKQMGIEIFRTDKNGEIIIKSDGKNIKEPMVYIP